jgi:hypothetical protein
MFAAFFLGICSGLLLLTGGCKDSSPAAIPEGPQIISGILVPADISLIRRGSHILRVDGEDKYFAESKQVNLRSFENRPVTLHGIFEENTDPSLPPVLVVNEISGDEGDKEKWSISTLGISLMLPQEWKGNKKAERIFVTTEGSELPIVFISSESLEDTSFDTFLEDKPESTPVVVKGKPAARIIDEETGDQIVYIDRGEDVLIIAFTPQDTSRSDYLRSQFLSLLHDITFDDEVVFPSSSSGTVLTGQPCGGSAGILCPTGMYCRVTDLQTGIGKCVKQ